VILKYLKQFLIPIAGLESGSHQYAFDIDGKFFESFGESEFQVCKITVDLALLKQEDMIVLQFRYNGTVELTCDRCLDPFDFPMVGNDEIILKFGKGSEEQKADEEIITADQKEIDIRQYLFDFINLNIPFRKVHPDDESGKSLCDPEVIRKIEELSNTRDTDPRWDQLKDLQIN
jgi:uncharacterized protein